jgi:hypothetical protein
VDSLSNSGYHVDLAIDGGDGLRRGRSNEYAVMTIDRMLPGLDGLFVFGGCANTESARIPSSRLSDPQCRPHYDGTFAAYDAKALNEPQLRGIRRQARDVDRVDNSLREWMTEAPKVFLEPSHHDRLQLLGLDVNAAGEPLWIEDFEQCREGVGMPFVGRGGEEKPVLEQGGDFPDRASSGFQRPMWSRMTVPRDGPHPR